MTRIGLAALVLLFGTLTGGVRAQPPVSTIPDDSAMAPRAAAAPSASDTNGDGTRSTTAAPTSFGPASSYWMGGHGPGCHEHNTTCCQKLCAYFSYCRKKCPCKCWGCCSGPLPRPYLFFLHPCYSGIGGPYPPCCASGGCRGCRGGCGDGGMGGCATCGH